MSTSFPGKIEKKKRRCSLTYTFRKNQQECCAGYSLSRGSLNKLFKHWLTIHWLRIVLKSRLVNIFFSIETLSNVQVRFDK
jgi:hypothetical protein